MALFVVAACGGGSKSSSSNTTTTTGTSGTPQIDAANLPADFSQMAKLKNLASEGKGMIGVLLPDTTTSARYVQYDAPYLKKAFQAAGLTSSQFKIDNAHGSTSTMQQQAEADITAGASVLLVDPLDPGSGAAIESKAMSQGVKVIDYDRLVTGGPKDRYYVSFNNVQVGKLIGQGEVDCISAWKVSKPALLVMSGDPTDNNAKLFAQGYNGVLKPHFDDGSYTKYHGLQLQLRRRYTQGLSANVNYTLSKTQADIWADNATQTVNYRTLRDRTFDAQVSPFDVRHVLQTYGTYDRPFGKDRRVGIDNRVLDAIAGGWTLGGIFTFQTGTPFRLMSGRSTVNGEDAGVILKNGLTVEDLQKMIQISPGPGFNRYWIDPKLIGPDGRANPAYLDVPTNPGEFGQIVYLRGRNNWSLDGSLNKQVRITSGVTFTMHVTATNVLNHPIWSTPGFLGQTSIQSITFGQSTQPANNANPRAVYLRGTIEF